MSTQVEKLFGENMQSLHSCPKDLRDKQFVLPVRVLFTTLSSWSLVGTSGISM